MKIAILGNGNIGRPTFDIIYNKEGKLFEDNNIEIKYVLIKSLEEAPFESPLFVTNFEIIENDPEIEVVMEIMGARISYEFIKRAILAKKHIITANKEVIAAHFTELEELAKANGVKLFFEAAVGGGIPIINTLSNNNTVNNIYRIEGILNGTTNYIITSMERENKSYQEALKAAQKLGFAEADPTNDVEGKDMVRKIAILSQIAYQGEVNYENVYTFGITKITKDFMNAANEMGRTLKYLATSEIHGSEVDITVEPVIIESSDLVCSVNYEYNFIRYFGDHSETQLVYGKGAGPATANSLVNDLALLIEGYDPYIKASKSLKVVGNKNSRAKYLLDCKETICDCFIDKMVDKYVLTKELTGEEFNNLLAKINFYAKLI